MAISLLLAGCRTALVFTGGVSTSSEQQALSVINELDTGLKKEGFTPDALPPGSTVIPKGVIRISSWWSPQRDVLVEAITKKEEVSLRIVPQPGANESSKAVAAQVQSLLQQRFPTLKVRIMEKPEADFLR